MPDSENQDCKKYKIANLIDILDIPDDKFDKFFQEFKDGMIQAKLIKSLTDNIPDSQPYEFREFTWVDDDEGEICLNMHSSEEKNGTN